MSLQHPLEDSYIQHLATCILSHQLIVIWWTNLKKKFGDSSVDAEFNGIINESLLFLSSIYITSCMT